MATAPSTQTDVLLPSQPLSLRRGAGMPAEGKRSNVLFTAPGGKLVLVALAQGHRWQEHKTPKHAIVQVISGECEMHLGGRTEVLSEGDLLHLEPDLLHSVIARAPTLLLLTLLNPGPR